MIDMLLNTTVTGGIVILLWFMTYPLSRKYFKASWHYTVLKIIMVFMVFPIGVFAGLIEQSNLHIPDQIQKVSINSNTVNSVNIALSEFVFPDFQYSPQLTQTEAKTIPEVPYLQIIWLITAIVLLFIGIWKMQKFKKQIITKSSGNVDSETIELFTRCKDELRIRGEIMLRISGYIKTPFVFGLIKPIVIFPETGMTLDEKRLAFRHELTHIKNGDLWLKFFAFVISSVHWFNPLAHLLYLKISSVSEEYCDERVVKKMTHDEKFLYGKLILKVVTDINAPQSKFCSTLSAPTKNLKRRLLNIMNTQKSRKSMIILSIVTVLMLCSLATMYAFAADVKEPDKIEEPSVGETDSEAIEEDSLTSAKIIGLGYDDNGILVTRISNDGGLTWNWKDENENLIHDPDLSKITWMKYDEFSKWIEKQDNNLQYEPMLENLKNGTCEIGIVKIKEVERVFQFGNDIFDNQITITRFSDPDKEIWIDFPSNFSLVLAKPLDDSTNIVMVYQAYVNNDGTIIAYPIRMEQINKN